MFLEIKQIKKSFGMGDSRIEVLKGIDLEIERGEFCVLLGPSGSGKSTLLNIIGGIDGADSGSITIDGERIEDMTEKKLSLYRRKHLGYIFQMYNLIPNLTVRENIEVGAYLSDKPLDVDELLHTLGIYEHQRKLPNQLSGGQQQRVAIALTAILITVLCGMEIGTVLATIKEKQMNPGPGCNGAAIMGGVEVYEKVLEQPEVEWADLARLCTEGAPHNKEFAGLTVRLLGVSDSFYGHQYVDLISGEYPKVPEEILLSDTMAEHLGMEMKPGQKMTLNLIVLRGGERVEEPVDGNFVDKKCIRDRI